METKNPERSQQSVQPAQTLSWKALREAARFWEPRRIVYNLLLAGVVAAWVIVSWPHFRPAFSLQGLVFLVVMALLANLCYCAAYLVDLPLQTSVQSAAWSRRVRLSVWVLGTLLAILFENYWIADEVYPFV